MCVLVWPQDMYVFKLLQFIKESHGISKKEVPLDALDLHIREAIENLILKEADLLCVFTMYPQKI